ncbi:cript family protein [Grosmannia clavigera kw1407]|uniref:Cript family protein n=1 Tax=Grosmannia clavigera (strain kw1407 / UAMH 11150) TaxID=655863 RepID=F0XC40_GROCL|nr:cript family protein [Grosmannia clavigera kw1407]EFX04412.1 cript family protein [Grosmannia clavigera kw1407]
MAPAAQRIRADVSGICHLASDISATRYSRIRTRTSVLNNMVCSRCAKLVTGTTLATPGVKKRSELYHGSLGSSSSAGAKKASTLGQTGIGKSKLTSKSAKNPYAQYASSCDKCKTKVSQGHKYCHNVRISGVVLLAVGGWC